MVTFTSKVMNAVHGKGQIQDMALAAYKGKVVIVTVTEQEERPKPIV